MKFITQLERDSDNSDPGEAELAVNDEILSIKLKDPERVIWLRREDVQRVLGD